MSIKFEKKVIIGSLFSFLATGVGIIAVFFPDLLNLQKEKIEELKMDVVRDQDVRKFHDFLTERSKDGKVFELDIIIPAPMYYRLNAVDGHGKKLDKFDEYEYSERVYLGKSVNYFEEGLGVEINDQVNTLTFNFEPLEDEYEDFYNEDKAIKLHWWDYKNREIDNAYEEQHVGLSPINLNDSTVEYYGTRWKEYHFPIKNTYIPTENGTNYPRLQMLNGKSVLWAVGIKGVFYVNEDNPEFFESISKEQLKLKNY